MREAQDPIEMIRAEVLRLLARSDRSRAALLHSLENRHPAAALQEALGRLEQEGLLDDRAAATRLASRWRERDLLAPPAIARKLAQRGFTEAVVAELIDALAFDEDAELERAMARWGLDPAHPGRLAARLERAGYEVDAVGEAIRRQLDD